MEIKCQHGQTFAGRVPLVDKRVYSPLAKEKEALEVDGKTEEQPDACLHKQKCLLGVDELSISKNHPSARRHGRVRAGQAHGYDRRSVFPVN